MQTIDEPPDVLFQITKASYRRHVTRDFCDALFQNGACTFEAENADCFVYRGKNNRETCPGATDHIEHFGVGDVWLTARYPTVENLSNLQTLFVLSYIFGMLVRYFPTQWTALVRSQIADAALPTIAAAIDWIESEYPRVVLGFLHEHRRQAPG